MGIRFQFLGCRVGVSDMQTRLIKTVAAHPYTGSVAEELLQYYFIVPLQGIALNAHLALLQDGNFVQRHIGSKLILQAVNINELTVKFFFIGVKLHKEGAPFLMITLHELLQFDFTRTFVGLLCSYITMCSSTT